MSWSVNRSGTIEKVREYVGPEFDKAAAMYTGTEEEKDVIAAKACTLSAIDGLKLDEYANAVDVKAFGSRSAYSMTLNVSVQRVALSI